MGKTDVKEFASFKGLANTIEPSLLDTTLIQVAQNVSFSRIPGIVATRLGYAHIDDNDWGEDVDIFWQNIFETSTLLLRAGDRLYDNFNAIKFNLSELEMQFVEYAGWVVAVNGDENLKYKASGTVLSWNTGYSSPIEEEYLTVGMKATLLVFLWATGDYFCCHAWEVEQMKGLVVAAVAVALLTSACSAGFTITTSNTKILLHCDGADASTTITESSGLANSYTCNGNAQLDTANYKFGSAALLLDGAGDYVSSTLSYGCEVTTGQDFALEAYVYVPTAGIVNPYGLIHTWEAVGTREAYLQYTQGSGHFHFALWSTFDGSTVSIASDPLTIYNTWYHVMVTRKNGYLRLYVNGVEQAGTTNSVGAQAFKIYPGHFEIGRVYIGASYYYYNGALDEIRLQTGVGYDADFTPPAAAFTVADETVSRPEVNVPVQIGITPPVSALTAADSGSAGSPNGAYSYKVTYVNNEAYESNPGPISNTVTVTSHSIRLTGLPISPDPQVTARRIYRTKAGGSVYYFVKEILDNVSVTLEDSELNSAAYAADPTTAYIIDDVADSAQILEPPSDHDVPPTFSEIESHYSLLYGVEAEDENKIWECKEFDEWEYFPPTNYYTFGSISDATFVLRSMGEFLCGVQQDKIWTLNTTSEPIEKQKSLSEQGTLSRDGCINKGDALILANTKGVWLFVKQNIFEAARSYSLSEAVRTLFEKFSTNAQRIDQTQGTKVVVGYANGQALISFPKYGSTLNDITLHINLDQKTVEGIWPVGFLAFTTDSHTKTLYGVEAISGKVCEIFTGDTDDAVPITWVAQTKDFAKEFGALTNKKRGNMVKVDCNPNGANLIVMVYVNGVQVDTKTITGASRTTTRWRLPIDYDWYRISFSMTGTGYQEVFSVGVEAETLEF